MSETFTPIGDLLAAGDVLVGGGGVPVYGVEATGFAHPATGVYTVALAAGSQVNRANANVKITLRDDAGVPVAADQPNWRIVVTGAVPTQVYTLEVRTYVGGAAADRAFSFEVTRRAIGGV